MKETEARVVASLLDVLDNLKDLRGELLEKKRDFYIAAQDKDECLNGSMTLPSESGVIFVDGALQEIRRRLVEYGVTPDPAPASE